MKHMPERKTSVEALNSLGASRLCRRLNRFSEEVEMSVNTARECVGSSKRGLETALEALHGSLNNVVEATASLEESLVSVLSPPEPACVSESEVEPVASPALHMVFEANQKISAIGAKLNALRCRLEL